MMGEVRNLYHKTNVTDIKAETGSKFFVFFYIVNNVKARIELREEANTMSTLIIQPEDKLSINIAMPRNGRLAFKAFIVGNDVPLFINGKQHVEFEVGNGLKNAAHMVVTEISKHGYEIESNHKTDKDNKNQAAEFRNIYIFLAFHNRLDNAVEISEMTGSMKSVLLLPFQIKRVLVTIKHSWPLLFRAYSGARDENVMLNGHDKLRIDIIQETKKIYDVVLTSSTQNQTTNESSSWQFMAKFKNKLPQPVVVADMSRNLKPMMLSPKQMCSVGFVISNSSSLLLFAVTLSGEPMNVMINGESLINVGANDVSESTRLVISTSNCTVAKICSNSTDGKGNNTAMSGDEDLRAMDIPVQQQAEGDKAHVGKEMFAMLSLQNTINSNVRIEDKTGVRKPFLVPAQSESRFGFSLKQSQPVVLEAHDQVSGKQYLLNDKRMLTVSLTDDPSVMTHVLITSSGTKELKKS